MANWKKVIVSGSDAHLNQVTASAGINIPTASIGLGSPDHFVLTISSSGDITRRAPDLGAAFQSMSIATSASLGSGVFGSSSFIAASGLNELVFVEGNNVNLATSQSLTDDNSATVGYIKISAQTASFEPVEHQTTISQSDNQFTIGAAQDISTGSNVTFATISGSKLKINGTQGSNLVELQNTTGTGKINIKADDSAGGYVTTINMDNTGLDIGHNSDVRAINLVTADKDRVTIKGDGKVGIGVIPPSDNANTLQISGSVSASGDISASALRIENDAQIDGDLGIGGNIFGLAGFGVTIDDVAITSGSVNFGSGSNPGTTEHRFTGSISVTGSDITLVDGVFTGDGNSLTNLDADNLVDIHDLTWGYGLTQSVGQGSAYNITTSIALQVHTSGSEITASSDGLYIPGGEIRLDHLTASADQGDIISFSGSAKTPYYIKAGTTGQVLTSNGTNTTASYQNLPASTAMGITGSFTTHVDSGNAISLIITSSTETISEVFISGSDNEISVTHSLVDNLITLKLAENVEISKSISTYAITASALRVNGDITASGNLEIGGNFTVAGTTTLLHTSNVLVEDAFLTLASGSTATDGGIVIQDSAESGRGFGWDNTIGRWGIQDSVHHTASNLTPTEWMMSVKLNNSNPTPSTTPSYGQSGNKASAGQFWINTGSAAQGGGDIWIYVD